MQIGKYTYEKASLQKSAVTKNAQLRKTGWFAITPSWALVELRSADMEAQLQKGAITKKRGNEKRAVTRKRLVRNYATSSPGGVTKCRYGGAVTERRSYERAR